MTKYPGRTFQFGQELVLRTGERVLFGSEVGKCVNGHRGIAVFDHGVKRVGVVCRPDVAATGSRKARRFGAPRHVKNLRAQLQNLEAKARKLKAIEKILLTGRSGGNTA